LFGAEGKTFLQKSVSQTKTYRGREVMEGKKSRRKSNTEPQRKQKTHSSRGESGTNFKIMMKKDAVRYNNKKRGKPNGFLGAEG